MPKETLESLGEVDNAINSPSRVMRDQIGKYLADGVGEGFVNEMSSISRDMAKIKAGKQRKKQSSNLHLRKMP